MKRIAITMTLLGLISWAALSCGSPELLSPTEVRIVWRSSLPSEVDDPVWGSAPLHTASLLLQDMVEPRLLQASTGSVGLRAVTDGSRLAVRMEWDDASRDDLPGVGRFADACAIQLPTQPGPDVPAPQMGEDAKPVEIAYWSAAWQAVVEGRPDEIQQLYPGATVDHYPFEAPSLEPDTAAQRELEALYSPARALGNQIGMTRNSAVQDLIAAGPGTLHPAPSSFSSGNGRHLGNRWMVVIQRPLPDFLTPGGRSQLAVAVWQGANQEVGARKMRSGWIPLFLEPRNQGELE